MLDKFFVSRLPDVSMMSSVKTVNFSTRSYFFSPENISLVLRMWVLKYCMSLRTAVPICTNLILICLRFDLLLSSEVSATSVSKDVNKQYNKTERVSDDREMASQAALPGALCDYSESSHDEDDDDDGDNDDEADDDDKGKGEEEEGSGVLREGVPRKTGGSPRKKRRRRSRDAEDDLLRGLPLDSDGNLNAEALFGVDFDAIGALEQRLAAILPGFAQEETRQAPKAVSATEQEYHASEFELRPSFRRPPRMPEQHQSGEQLEKAEDVVDENLSGGDSDALFPKPRPRNRKFIFKPFRRLSDGRLEHDEDGTAVDVVIPEQLAASFGLYLWPASPVLSWYVWLHQKEFVGKNVLELGAGTSLPGLLCAKVGAARVWLADVATDKDVLDNCREAVRLNALQDRVEVAGVTWGRFDPDIFRLGDQHLDYILGSDLFFDPGVFEPLSVTLSFLLERNPQARALISVQDRSGDWSVEEHLVKWGLKGSLIYPREFLRGTGIDEGDLTGKHTIFILEISRRC